MIALDRVIVSSTDVNRRPGEVLDRAQKGPVLVTRGDEPLVIATHAMVLNLVEGDSRGGLMSDLAEYFARRFGARDMRDHGGSFDWLTQFDDGDVLEFLGELRAAYRDARARTGTWSVFDDVIHQWRESAIRPLEYIAQVENPATTRA